VNPSKLILYEGAALMKIASDIFKSTKKEILQYCTYFYLSGIVAVYAIAVYVINPDVFNRFTGNINPMVVLFGSCFLGYFLFVFLNSRTALTIYRNNKPITYLIIACISLLFGIEIIAADIWIADYPKDLNVSFPESLLFYPAIGYIVEIIFHLLPISVIIFLLAFFTKLSMNKIVWISIITVSIIEPVYQIQFTNQSSSITVIYTSVHVFLFSITQLLIFKRFDFISMYLFRIIFYLIWHIIWGHLRLSLLF